MCPHHPSLRWIGYSGQTGQCSWQQTLRWNHCGWAAANDVIAWRMAGHTHGKQCSYVNVVSWPVIVCATGSTPSHCHPHNTVSDRWVLGIPLTCVVASGTSTPVREDRANSICDSYPGMAIQFSNPGGKSVQDFHAQKAGWVNNAGWPNGRVSGTIMGGG